MEVSTLALVYVGLVLAAGAFALVRTQRFLESTLHRRVRRLEERRRFEAVRTLTPIDHPREVARTRGLESIQSHFTVMRRLLIPFILGTTLVLAVAPFVVGAASIPAATLLGVVLTAVLGLALRPFLENAFSGLVIGASRLVRIGDTVRIDDWYGTVEDITLTHTAIKVWDWRRYLVPNARMLDKTFFNYSLFDTYQWAYVEFWVAPDADIEAVRTIALAIPPHSPSYFAHEEPKFWVIGIEKDSVCCWIAAWASSPSAAWALTNDVRTELLREMRQRGIPFSLQRIAWSGAEASGEPADRPPSGP